MSAGVVERLAELRDWREADLQGERERAASCGQRWTDADLAEQRSWATVRSISLAELSAAIDLIEQLQARLAEAEVVVRPFAEAARNFDFAIGPDGVDDGLTILAAVYCRPERQADLSTADFSAAASWLAGR